MLRSRPLPAGPVLVLLLAVAGAPAAAEDRSFTTCEESYAASSGGWNDCLCFYLLGKKEEHRSEAIRRL